MAYAERILATVSPSMPNWQYWLLANDLATWFHDPHTQATPPILTPHQALLDRVIRAAYPGYHWYHYSGAMQPTFIPLGFYWTANGLIAMPMAGSPPSVHLGDRVVRVGKLTIPALQERLSRLISGNRYWVRWNGAQDLTLGYFLHWLGVVSSDDEVPLTLRRADGQAYSVNLSLEREPAARLARVYNRAYEAFLDAFRAPLASPILPLRMRGTSHLRETTLSFGSVFAGIHLLTSRQSTSSFRRSRLNTCRASSSICKRTPAAIRE